MIELINLTQHDVKVKVRISERVKYDHIFPASGEVARVETKDEFEGYVEDITIFTRKKAGVIGLPPATKGKAYIVSSMVLDVAFGRTDVYAPDTGETAIRDEKGRITAVIRLIGNKGSGNNG